MIHTSLHSACWYAVQVRLWDLSNGDCLVTLKGHKVGLVGIE